MEKTKGRIIAEKILDILIMESDYAIKIPYSMMYTIHGALPFNLYNMNIEPMTIQDVLLAVDDKMEEDEKLREIIMEETKNHGWKEHFNNIFYTNRIAGATNGRLIYVRELCTTWEDFNKLMNDIKDMKYLSPNIFSYHHDLIIEKCISMIDMKLMMAVNSDISITEMENCITYITSRTTNELKVLRRLINSEIVLDNSKYEEIPLKIFAKRWNKMQGATRRAVVRNYITDYSSIICKENADKLSNFIDKIEGIDDKVYKNIKNHYNKIYVEYIL